MLGNNLGEKMPKINWKGIGKVALGIGEQLFPVIKVIESLKDIKQVSSKEAQDIAFKVLHDELVGQLLPSEAQDPRIESAIRNFIDAGVNVNNAIALVKSEHPTNA